MNIYLVHGAKVDAERAIAHAVERGIGVIKHGIPPWLEHTGQVPGRLLDGDGMCVVVECDKHPYEVLAVIPHGDVRAKDLEQSVVCTTPDPPVGEIEQIDVRGLPLPFREALRDLVKTWEDASRGERVIPSAGSLLKFR